MVDDVLSEAEDGMQRAIQAFERELAKIRTGRANLSLLDGIKVDYYGSATPLNQVATLNVADARMITIKPWEKGLVSVIEKAVQASELGLNPVVDADLIRLPVPPLTQERRKELVKVVNRITEDARKAVRGARREANDLLKDALKEKEISEDENKQGRKKIQELTDKFVAKVGDIGEAKEKEIMEV